MYFEFFKHQDKSRILILDTNELDFHNDEDTYQKIKNLLDQPYELGLHYVSIEPSVNHNSI